MPQDGESSDLETLPPAPTAPAVTRERIRLIVLALLTGGLIVLSVALAVPFLPAITWAVALAIMAWPVHRWIARRVSSRGLAAGISTGLVAATLLATGLFAAYKIAGETAAAAERMESGSGGGDPWDRLASVPVLGNAVRWLERMGLDVQEAAGTFVRSHLDDTPAAAQGSVMAVVQFLLAMFILYYLLRDRDVFLDGLRDLLPLSEGESNFLMGRAADSVHATLYATVLTSVIDTVAFGLAFWATGVPAPVLWSVVLFLLSLLPVLGSGLIWVPATAYLAMNGSWLGAAALVAVGVVTATFVDNILYARLAGGRMRMHNVPVLIAFVGGLAVFGMSGMVLGPAILAVTEAILELWRRRLAGSRDPRTPAERREPVAAGPS